MRTTKTVSDYPELVAQWSSKNEQPPESFSAGSHKKVFWVCSKGHEWEAKIDGRVRTGSNCPYCSGRLAAPGETLFDLFPSLETEWDYDKNILDPRVLHPGTLKKAYWRCKNGHSYQSGIRYRTVRKTDCPECNSFGFNYPKLAKTWHPKNGSTPNQVAQGSGKKVFWICENGHEWSSQVASRRKRGCPHCAGQRVSKTNNFSAKFPEKALHWDFSKNTQAPETVASQTSKRFWFKCANGHSFDSKLNNIANGKWCPFCSNKKVGYGNSLADTNQALATEWHPTKNKINAQEITAGSNRKAWWVCEKGHEWEANIASRNKGHSCPFCANRSVGYGNSLAEHSPHLVGQIDFTRSSVDPNKVTAFSEQKLWWKCDFGHSWKAPIRRRAITGTGCRYCTSQTSAPEIRLFCELKSVFTDTLGREKLDGVEADMIIPSLKISIEYDGYYFHQDKADKDHLKTQHFSNLGYEMFRLRETPLLIGNRDVSVSPGPNAPTKEEINQLFMKLVNGRPNILSIVQQYVDRNEFMAEEEFKRILSYLPGPPEEDSLAELHRTVSKDWNYKKNYPLKPEMFHPKSGKKVWWICEQEHEWEATIDKRTGGGRGCPYCTNKKLGYGNSLQDKFPDVAAMWYQPGNGQLTPKDVTAGSGFHAWWQCENGHIYKARVADKTRKQGKCLHCPGKGRNRKYTPPNFE